MKLIDVIEKPVFKLSTKPAVLREGLCSPDLPPDQINLKCLQAVFELVKTDYRS